MEIFEQLSQDPRVTIRRTGAPDAEGACVVYWMQRAQRALDNPALDVAVAAGNALRKPVVVFFAPVPFYPHANLRHFQFLREGIHDIGTTLVKRRIGFVLRSYPNHELLRFLKEVKPAMVIGDENPLREPEAWRGKIARAISVPFWTVDADIIVPSQLMGREHYGARAIRPRLHELLPQFLKYPSNPKARTPWSQPRGLHTLAWDEDITHSWKIDRSVQPVRFWRGGTSEGLRLLREFIDHKLQGYVKKRNHPETDGTSQLSPYLHFGHLGPHTVVAAVHKAKLPESLKQPFLEQLIVRRELSVNFVRFNSAYDSMDCLEPWAERSFARHSSDPRLVVYSEKQLENAETHDPLWNAAQKQMVVTGWMHNYLRMYWAKKILEWSPSVALAYRRAVWLNDKYELDGRDPNGYAGIAWAIVGKHDRPWFERPIFGQVRYMSLASTGRKFDSKKYAAQMAAIESPENVSPRTGDRIEKRK